MSLFETLSVNGGDVLSPEFDGYFQAEEEAVRKKAIALAKLQTNKPIGICRRTRTSSELPTSIDGNEGITRDVSCSGVYVVQSSKYKVGSKIDCVIDLDASNSKLKLCCTGIVVRIEKVNGRFGIGLKILSQTTMHYN